MDKYRLIGPIYDLLSRIYSAGAIKRSKLSMLRTDTIVKDSKVLVAGAGHGSDAIRAAELGAQVTVIDISATMIARFKAQLAKHPQTSELKINTQQADIFKYQSREQFDVVICHYFLNVFDRTTMRHLLKHLAKQVKPGGQFMLADFKPDTGHALHRGIQNIYWYAAAGAFCLFAGNALHRLYDYGPLLKAAGFEITETQDFKVAGAKLYYALRGVKV